MTAPSYIPGFARAKAGLVLLGLALAALGLAQCAEPLLALARGTTRRAVVVRVVRGEPGQPEIVHQTRAPIPEEPNRAVSFQPWVEIASPGGLSEVRRLRLSTQMKPAVRVGEELWVSLPPGDSADAIAITHLQTWTAGVFLLLFGLVFAGAFLLLWRRARQPIVLPADLARPPAGGAAI